MTEQHPDQQNEHGASLATASAAVAAAVGDPAGTLAAVGEALAALQAITHEVASTLARSEALPHSHAQADLFHARSLTREVVARLGEARARCLQAAGAAAVVLPRLPRPE